MDCGKDSMQAPPGWRLDPRCIECRTKWASLMMPPSLHARVKAVAEAAGAGFNSWCLSVLEAALKDAERAQEDADALNAADAGASEGNCPEADSPAGEA